MKPILLTGLRAANLRIPKLELERNRWTAIHGPSGSGKSALLFRVLEPVARRRFQILHDPGVLPGGEEDWLAPMARRVEGLQPVLAWAGEIPRSRRGVELGAALDLWGFLASIWARCGERQCTACGTRWPPPKVEEVAVDIAGRIRAGEILHLFSHAGGCSLETLIAGGWTRARLGGRLVRLEEAPDPLPGDALLLLDRFRWSPGREHRLRESLAEAMRRGTELAWESPAGIERVPARDLCPACGRQLEARPVETLPGLREARDLILLDRAWDAWRRAPLAEWLCFPGRGESARLRIEHLVRTGLGHLAPDRTLGTLSLGEARRLELAALLGQIRRDQLVLLDEPGMGLHGKERRNLALLLRDLVGQGNTVLTADPSREFLEAADAWIELGPGGGPRGGRLVARGGPRNLPELEACEPAPDSLAVCPHKALVFSRLKSRFLDIPKLGLPLGCLTAIAGVSGSGKTTLFEEELVPRLRGETNFRGRLPPGGVTVLLQRALRHASISTVATLSGAWSLLRRAFAAGEEGRIRGLAPADFVARPRQGGCRSCQGRGCDPFGVECPVCGGLGLRNDLLEVRLRSRPLREWLSTPLARIERRLGMAGDPRLRNLVRHLVALGLGDRCLGERGRWLSLGERSRIALARALAAARRGREQLFLLDEPCLGLPFSEARRVVALLRKLTREGHTFWVVEHHEVLLRSADWLVELGPGAGPEGGKVLYEGMPAGILEAGTPTGTWLATRGRPMPPAPRRRSPRSPRTEVLRESWKREGRRALERELWRELATRSPLVADLRPPEHAAGEAGRALPPTAWPVIPGDSTRLLALLGLEGALESLFRKRGTAVCVHCAGGGAWEGLREALATWQQDRPQGCKLLFSTPLSLERMAGPEILAWLQAAGFRRLLRGGRIWAPKRGELPRAGDEVELDRLDPRGTEAAGRLRDVEHHARLLGGGEVVVRGPGGKTRRYRPGACRDCGRGGIVGPAPLETRLGGWTRERIREAPLWEALEHLEACSPRGNSFRRARDLLRGSSLMERPAGVPIGRLTFLERRLARLAGWLLFPLPGVVLLHDQPLSGFPVELAMRLGKALRAPGSGVHRFTDPEGFCAPSAAPSKGKPLEGLPRRGVEPFSLELDGTGWGDPPPCAGAMRLREALGLEAPLRDHFLRTEEARLRGWGRRDLARGPGGRICPQCRGRGGFSPHPALLLACPRCGGSGFGRETAVLEDRGLRWLDLGHQPLTGLRKHFSQTPRLAAVLRVAADLGLGGAPLDTPLFRLPLGARVLAPLAGRLAAGEAGSSLRLLAPAAGLTPLEAAKLLSRMQGYLSIMEDPVWKDHHPALLAALNRKH